LVKLIIGHARLILIVISITSLLALTFSLTEYPENPIELANIEQNGPRSFHPGNMPAATKDNTNREPSSPGAIRLETLSQEKNWLTRCQLPNGALAQTPDSDRVIPYFSNLAARTLIELDPESARRYMVWYLSNLNRPDRWGLTGTIYDFKAERYISDTDMGISGVVMKSTRNYDSADSYAATFLSLVADYYRKTGDIDFLQAHLDDINLVAKVIEDLQDKDGLVFVKPGSRTKYLMDNAENYRGLMDWSSVLKEQGDMSLASQYKDVAAKIKYGIDQTLYSEELGTYAWSLSFLGRRFPREGKWYPDGVSQLYLVTCGVISPQDPKAIKIWHDFNESFPGWESGKKKDEFPWSSVAIASFIMGDYHRALRFLAWAEETFLINGRTYPWYVLESSNLVTLTKLADKANEANLAPLARN